MEEEDKIIDELRQMKEELQEINGTVSETLKKEEKQGFVITETKGTKDAVMRVKEFDSSYVGDLSLATDIYHAQRLGMKLRQLEIKLKGGMVAFDSGQFLESTGDVNIGQMSMNPMEWVRGVIRKMNDETFFRPTIQGNGIVTLDSSFKFITLFPVPDKSRIVLEKGIYLASIGEFEFRTTKNFNPGYMVFSGKEIFQTDVRGSGVLALELPVHRSELVERDVTPESPLMINGNYVLMWSGNLKRSVRPAGKIFGSLSSGAGIVEEYSGTGKVWYAPTLGYFKNIASDLKGSTESSDRHNGLNESEHGKMKTSWWDKIFARK